MKKLVFYFSLFIAFSQHAWADPTLSPPSGQAPNYTADPACLAKWSKMVCDYAAKKKAMEDQQAAKQKAMQPALPDNSKTPSPKAKEIEAANAALLKQGQWTDPNTGLTWVRCPLGQLWDTANQVCSKIDKPIWLTWDEAVLSVKNKTLYDYNDWRIPTAPEISTIFINKDCENTPTIDISRKDSAYRGCDYLSPPNGVFDIPEISTLSIWTVTPSQYPSYPPTPRMVVLAADSSGKFSFSTRIRFPETQSITPIGWERSADFQSNVYLVRGGPSNGAFDEANAIAQADLKVLKERKSKSVTQQQATTQRAQQDKQQRDAKLEKFRVAIKAGDRVKQGLVLEVKGELINVQTHEKQCTDYSAHINPWSGQPDCIQYKTVSSGQQWFKRNELMP